MKQEFRKNAEHEAYSIAEACASTNIGRTKIYEAISSGQLRARKWGKRTIILKDDLRAFLSALPSRGD